MLPRKIFEKLHTEVAILALFEQPLNLSVSPNMVHFIHTFSIMRAQGVGLIVIKKVRNYAKTVFIKKHV